MWDRNRKVGRAFEVEQFGGFKQNYTEAQEQITIVVKNDAGEEIRTRVDAIGLDSNGNIVIHEYKASLTAPLTENQKEAFKWMETNGGVVVGEGKSIFTAGKEIKIGTVVEVIRKQ